MSGYNQFTDYLRLTDQVFPERSRNTPSGLEHQFQSALKFDLCEDADSFAYRRPPRRKQQHAHRTSIASNLGPRHDTRSRSYQNSPTLNALTRPSVSRCRSTSAHGDDIRVCQTNIDNWFPHRSESESTSSTRDPISSRRLNRSCMDPQVYEKELTDSIPQSSSINSASLTSQLHRDTILSLPDARQASTTDGNVYFDQSSEAHGSLPTPGYSCRPSLSATLKSGHSPVLEKRTFAELDVYYREHLSTSSPDGGITWQQTKRFANMMERLVHDAVEKKFTDKAANTSTSSMVSRSMCAFCVRNGETVEYCNTHMLKDIRGKVICPVLRKYVCPNCRATGDHAHTLRHCPLSQNTASVSETFKTPRTSCGLRKPSSC